MAGKSNSLHRTRTLLAVAVWWFGYFSFAFTSVYLAALANILSVCLLVCLFVCLFVGWLAGCVAISLFFVVVVALTAYCITLWLIICCVQLRVVNTKMSFANYLMHSLSMCVYIAYDYYFSICE